MTLSERHSPSESLYTMPLVNVSIEHGTEGLTERFYHTLGKTGLSDDAMDLIWRAYDLSAAVHADDKRTYEPFINHPLRVAARLIEEREITDPETIASALLHDTVEDQARHLIKLVFNEEPPSDSLQLQKRACQVLEQAFTPKIADNVAWLSRKPHKPGKDRNVAYIEDIRFLTEEGPPEPVAIKGADHKDNTVVPSGLEDKNKRRRLDRKQIGTYILHARALWRPDSLVTGIPRQDAASELLEGYMNARARMATAHDTSSHQTPLRST